MLGDASLQTLVHWGALFVGISLKATVILLLVLGITRLLNTRHAACQSVILNAGMLALLLLPLGSLYLPNLPILPRPQWLPTLSIPSTEPAPASQTTVITPAPLTHFTEIVPEPAQVTPTPNNPIPHIQSIIVMTLSFYLIGLAIMAFRLGGGILYLVTLRQKSTPIPAPLAQRLKHLVNQLGLRRTVHLTFSARVNSPTQIGIFQPIIVLPTHLKTTSNTQLLDMILLHELGHAYRWDCLARFMALCVRTLYWYHPLAWFTTRQFSETQELACDDWVVRQTNNMRGYAEALLDVTAHLQTTRPVVLGMSFPRTTRIIKRVQRLMDNNIRPDIGRWTATVITVILLLGSSVVASLQLLSKLPSILPKDQLTQIQILLQNTTFDTEPPTPRPLSIPAPQPISYLKIIPPDPIAKMLAQIPDLDQQPRIRYSEQFQKRHVISGQVNMSYVPGTTFTVAVYPVTSSTARPVQEVHVGHDGQFIVPYLKPGNYVVALMRAEKNQNGTWQKTRVRAKSVPLSNYNAHIAFQPLGEWRVRGSAYLDDAPVEGAIVAAYNRNPDSNALQMVSGAITDPQGQYLLTDLPEGQIYLGLLKTTPSEQASVSKRISAVDTLDLRFDGGIPQRVNMKVEYQNAQPANQKIPDITAIDGLITSSK